MDFVYKKPLTYATSRNGSKCDANEGDEPFATTTTN